ncbi:phage holin family protein [Robertkochia solimangrovi]|uniref:phage holin family protein n=1 Tax=Robertkochia solimangrovi TaxID=2213046 RepID=UPI001180407D|nr:phage holin family protein [Robertkochia solimangrovi]TRZ44428.1 phage holin family protein [Robertkochia solimangrovi]
MKLILKVLLSALAVIILEKILPGISVDKFSTAIIIAIVLAILNLIVKPILVILTLPVTIITLGLFLLVINAILILFADGLIDGFDVSNFWWAIIFSVLFSILQSILYSLIKEDK